MTFGWKRRVGMFLVGLLALWLGIGLRSHAALAGDVVIALGVASIIVATALGRPQRIAYIAVLGCFLGLSIAAAAISDVTGTRIVATLISLAWAGLLVSALRRDDMSLPAPRTPSD
jgi:hypothetical protein